MNLLPWRRIFAPILLSLLLLTTACNPKPTSPYAQIQQETTQRNAAPAVAKTATQGAAFNKFFPRGVKNYEIVPTQEKKGFAEYKVKQGGKTVAMLSISDTLSLPSTATKYNGSSLSVAGYPAVEQGTTATGLLVNGRYQVKVLSRDPAFTKEDRLAWLQKFDLKGLAKLETALYPQPKAIPAKTPVLSPRPAA